MASAGLLFVELLQEQNDSALTTTLLEAFLGVCSALQVSDPSDPLSKIIARTVIHIAAAGERDPRVLYERTLDNMSIDN